MTDLVKHAYRSINKNKGEESDTTVLAINTENVGMLKRALESHVEFSKLRSAELDKEGDFGSAAIVRENGDILEALLLALNGAASNLHVRGSLDDVLTHYEHGFGNS